MQIKCKERYMIWHPEIARILTKHFYVYWTALCTSTVSSISAVLPCMLLYVYVTLVDPNVTGRDAQDVC